MLPELSDLGLRQGHSKLLLELWLHLEPIYHLKTEVGADTDGTGKTGH